MFLWLPRVYFKKQETNGALSIDNFDSFLLRSVNLNVGWSSYLRIENAEGCVLIAIYLFVCVLLA